MRVLLITDQTQQQRVIARLISAPPVKTETSMANSLIHALDTLKHERPFDVAIVDLNCIGLDGIRQIGAQQPQLKLLVFSFPNKGLDIHPDISRAMAGLSVLAKRNGVDASDACIAVPSLKSGVSRLHCLPRSGTRAATPTKDARPHLTPRQMDVLALISEGHSTKSIARMLDIAEGTVKVHTMAIFRELNVSNRTQAAKKAHAVLGERSVEPAKCTSGNAR